MHSVFVCLFVCLFVRLAVCLFGSIAAWLLSYVFVCLFVCLRVRGWLIEPLVVRFCVCLCVFVVCVLRSLFV